jgi:hypothetical protein
LGAKAVDWLGDVLARDDKGFVHEHLSSVTA